MVMVTLTASNGAQFFAFYAQVILGKIFVGGETSISISLVMNLMLVSEALAQFTSMLLVRKVSRRTLLITYGISLACLNTLLVLLDIWNLNTLAVVIILLMVFSSECLGVPVQTIYTIEVMNNSALGFIQLYSNIVFMLVSFFVAQMVHFFSVPVLFSICAGLCLVQALFVAFFVKETSGLTDKEKKSLYASKHID